MTEGKPNSAALARIEERLSNIAALARELAPETGDVATILAECERSLKRAKKRLEALPQHWERVEIVPLAGAKVEFTGRVLRVDEFDTARGKVRVEIWETEAGNLVAVDSFDDGEYGERLKVCTPDGGTEDQRMAIMEFLGWTNRARSMARKLGWSIRRDLD